MAEDGAYVAALVTDLTPELVAEGMAREFVRRVQDFRKNRAWMWPTGSILYVTASEELRRAIQRHSEYISTETLARELLFSAAPKARSPLTMDLIAKPSRSRW